MRTTYRQALQNTPSQNCPAYNPVAKDRIYICTEPTLIAWQADTPRNQQARPQHKPPQHNMHFPGPTTETPTTRVTKHRRHWWNSTKWTGSNPEETVKDSGARKDTM